MAFVRMKKIGGKPYAYLVENRWEGGRARQTVAQYLGRVHDVTKISESISPDVNTHSFPDAVELLIANELTNHGFSRRENVFVRDQLSVNMTDFNVRNKNKPAVLKINDGFLCTHTLHQLRNFQPVENEQKTGYALARKLVEAGIAVPRETFVALFDKVQQSEESQNAQ